MDNPITLTVRGFRDAAARERWFRAEVAALGTTGVARTTAEEILGLSRRFVRLEARFQKLFSGAGMQWNVGTLIMGDHTGPMPPWRRNALSRFPSLIREGDAILVELCSTVSAEMARTGKSAAPTVRRLIDAARHLYEASRGLAQLSFPGNRFALLLVTSGVSVFAVAASSQRIS